MKDPVETPIKEALDKAGIYYKSGIGTNGGPDFQLNTIVIECKQFYSDRAIRQMSNYDNAILVQGVEAANWLANLIKNSS